MVIKAPEDCETLKGFVFNIRLRIIHGEFALRFGRIGGLSNTHYAKPCDLLEL